MALLDRVGNDDEDDVMLVAETLLDLIPEYLHLQGSILALVEALYRFVVLLTIVFQSQG